MNARRHADQFAARGFDPLEAAARASLVDRATAALVERRGHRPAWAWFVPGRVEVIGKHTDYAGGRSLVAAVPRGFAAVAWPRDDDTVSVADAVRGDRIEIDLSAPSSSPVRGWGTYVSAVAHRLAGNFPGARLGASMAVASDLPRSAGLSSSSALVVAVALALIRRGALETRDDWRHAIPDGLALAGYLGAIENGLAFGPWPGTAGVGTHGGSEDHTAIVNARAGVLSAYAYVPVRHLADVTLPPDWRFIVMTSGVRAEKAGSARDRYNRASLASQALRDLYNTRTGLERPTLASILESGPGAAEALRSGLGESGPPFGAGMLARRLAHFERENDRVAEMVDAIGRADEAGVGALAAASQRDAAELLGNQVDETERLAALARAAGAFAATSFGAGFGGSVWALAHADDAVRAAETWRRCYLDATPAVRDVECFIATPAPGAFEIDL